MPTQQKGKIVSNIANLFTSVDGRGWYDTGGILASLADLVIRKSNDSPKIFVQPGTNGQQQLLSDELKEISNLGKDVIYIRCSPVNKEGKSSLHWVVFYFSKDEKGKHNLLVVDPYGANEVSEVIKGAVKERKIVDNIYISTTKIQHDGNSCGPISSEVARAIYFQKGKLQELLGGNDRKIDIKQILPDGLIMDARENGKVDYELGFENFNCSKIRNAHVQTARAVGETILDEIDMIPSQVLISNILTGKENSLTEQTATLTHGSIESIFNLCQDNNEEKKKVASILVSENVTDETLDQEIALLLSQNEVKVNVKQIGDLEKTLDEGRFEAIKKKLNAQIQQPQLSQLSNEQKEKIGQIRKNFELELTSNDLLFFDSNSDVQNSEDLSKKAFTAARNGDILELKGLVNRSNNIHDGSIIYKTDISGKSLLEVAAESFHSEVVQYIIREHNKICKNQNGKMADEVSPKFLGFVNNIDDRKDLWAKDLARKLKRILHKGDFNESDRLKIDKIFSLYIGNKEQEKEVKSFNIDDYGNLSFYADVIKYQGREKFKTVLEKIDPNRKLYLLFNSNGHNLITLTAALGEPNLWKEIEKAYSKVEGRTAISASLDNMSSIGSPIQVAIIANNSLMYEYFFGLEGGFVVNKQYGTEENNILHTVLQSDRVELLDNILSKFENNKKPLIEALLQVNKDNKNPLDLALEKGHYNFFKGALDVIASHDKGTIGDSLIADDCRLIKSVVSFGNKKAVKKVLSLQDEYNKSVKDKKYRLNLLNYNNRYGKKNRLEESGLLSLACKHNNVNAVKYILELLKEKDKVPSEVLVSALTASISKDSDNKEIFDSLLGQDIDFETFSERITARYSPIHKAVECGNISALEYFVDKFPKNNVLNLQDENGRTPLHLAISNGNRKVVEFLIKSKADFNKSDNRGITPFELALGDNRFADICIDLQKYNPKATVPIYRAILSGNKRLIEKLIDQNRWVLDQCSPDTLSPNVLGGETALKLALRSGINKDLTAKIADKSIENFKRLDKKSQKDLLKLGFLNDIVKSGICGLYKEGSEEAGKINDFITSEVKKDSSLLSVTSQGTTLLYDIVGSNNFDLFAEVESDIGYGVIKIKSGELEETALHAAVRSGNANIVKTMLEKIGDGEDTKLAVNEYDAKGYTPFQIAAKLGYKEIYDLLKEKGGDLKSKTKGGDSIAHLLILSAMKDSADGSYEYQKLLKDYHGLTEHVNNVGDSLLATAARCTNQDEAFKIMTQLLDNEFKHKKGQFTEEDAIRLMFNVMSSGNSGVVQKVVFDNMKGKSISQEHIHNISKAKVLSQSIKKSLSSGEEKKQSLLQNALNFPHIKVQKSSSNKVDINTLFNFLVEDQSSYTNSKDNLFLVEEEVKISGVRKNIFENQEKLNKEIDSYQSDAGLPKAKVSQDVLYVNCRNLVGKSIADRIFTSNELPLIRGVILENENLWDPKFVDSKGDTLLHKLAQMVEKDNTLIDYIQPLIDQGFSLTRKNSEGKSAKDIFEDIRNNDEIKGRINGLTEKAEAEEQIHKLFEKESNSLLERGSADDLAEAIRDDKQGCKKYYGTIFNPFHRVVSSCFNDDLSNDYLFKKRLNCFKELFKSGDLRSALNKTDEKRYNFLHRAIEEAAANYSGSSTNKMLECILLYVACGLNNSGDFELCNELFFKQRNSNGDNVIEALSRIQNNLNVFKKLEKEFGRNAFTDKCDLNLILVNAAGSKNNDLFEHVIERYALSRFRTPSDEGQPPLHAAVMSGDQKTVLAVLKSGANINQINSSSRTALHELLRFLGDNLGSQEHMDLVNYLVSHGASLSPYQEEERNKERGEISEVIEFMDEDIKKEEVLFSIARGRSSFYDLKHSLLSGAENFIKLKDKDNPLTLDLDVAGSVVFTKINNGTFKSSQFLNSDVCKSNHLTASYFDIDGCKGYVQKSVGGKRNYVIIEDAVSEENGKEVYHPTKIKVWLSKKQSIIVLVSADGTIEPAGISHKIMGVEIKGDLSEYRVGKEECAENYPEYVNYIKKLWKKVDSQDEYKNEVYIGGIPLKEALMRGRWHYKNLQKQQQTQSEMEERVQKSSENNIPNHSRRNSENDGMGTTIEGAQIDHGQVSRELQPGSNNIVAADAKSYEKSETEAAYSEQEGSTRLGVESQKNDQSIGRLSMNDNIKFENLDELEQRFNQENYGLKSVPSQKQHSDSDKLVSELEQRLAQPDKGLKSVPSQEQHSDSDKLVSELEQRLAQPDKGLKSVPSQKQHSDSGKLVSELEQRLAQPDKGLKSVPSQEQHSNSDKLVSELEQRLAQPDKGLKSVPSQEQHSNSDKLVSELEQRLAQPDKGLKKLNPNEYYISSKTQERLGNLLGNKVDGKYLESKKAVKLIHKYQIARKLKMPSSNR